MENIVTIDNLSHRYSKDWAVRDVSFNIKKRGIVGLLGSNGAGKSTIMNILCGIIAPTRGQVTIQEHDIKESPIAAKKLLGFLPQKAPLYLDLTVDEYLFHCARLRQIPKESIKASVENVKEYCGVKEYGKRLIGNLSGGYQQRVGIAQAIIHQPKLVVLDEPTNGLDPVQITEVRSLIRDISKDSAVLLSTHILSEVQAMCERIIMIEKGKMVFSGNLSAFNNLIKPNTLILQMNNPPSIDQLESIEGIKSASMSNQKSVKLNLENGAEIAKELIELGVQKKWEITELYKEKVSLDTIFAKLSNRELKN